jgi:hypothetical protein
MIAPVDSPHCVEQSFESLDLHSVRLLSWHFSWQSAFAVAVHEPVQSALHLVLQSALVDTVVHCVLQWSSQQAPHDAWQSVDDSEDVDPSGDVDDDDELVHDELQPDSQRELQSVVQSKLVLDEHIVEQLDVQVDVQLESADVVHCESHCCSS